MADDDDVWGAPGAEDPLAPSGPRRSSFTPAPNDAQTLEAAANIFNDDAIAAALSAELARVASGPIPIQRPAAASPEPITAPPVVAAPPVVSAEPVVPAQPAVAEPTVAAQQVEPPEPQATQPQAPATGAPGQLVTEQLVTEQPAPPSPTSVPEVPAPSGIPQDAPGDEKAEQDAAEQDVHSVPAPAPAVQPTVAPQGPPDWATPLFGQPTAAESSHPVEPVGDPFAPNAPSFAPSSGPFPPPGDSVPEPVGNAFGGPSPFGVPAAQVPPIDDPDALRALYSAAPAPTVPAADAPPPPGYQAGPPAPQAPIADSSYVAASGAVDSGPSDAGTSDFGTLSAIEELEAHLDQRDLESRDDDQKNLLVADAGTQEPSAPLAPPTEEPIASYPSPVDQPPVAPTAQEPPSFATPAVQEQVGFPAAPVEEPVSFAAPPVEEPVSFAPPPIDDPVSIADPSAEELPRFPTPPAAEPLSFLPPPNEEPFAFAPPAAAEPAPFGATPAESQVSFLPPPSFEGPAAFLPPPAEDPVSFGAPAWLAEPASLAEPAAFAESTPLPAPASSPLSAEVPEQSAPAPEPNPFDIFGATIDNVPPAAQSVGEPAPAFGSATPPPPVDEPLGFPGFAPPTDASTLEFSAPTDPHELSFEPPTDSYPVPDAPIFLEPVSPESAPEPTSVWSLDAVPTEPAPAEPPALVEPPGPNGLADLWAAASGEPLSPPAPAVPSAPFVSAPPAWDAPPGAPGPADVEPADVEPAFTEPAFAAPPFEAAAPVFPAPPAEAPAPFTAPPADAPAAFAGPPPPLVGGGFDDLLTGGQDPSPESAGVAWSEPQGQAPIEQPDIDPDTGEKRPFGEGVDRDEAVDPSDSVFGPPPVAVGVSTSAVVAASQYVVVESRPISVLVEPDGAAPVRVPPPVFVAESVGLEPTVTEQRVGRSARLFWLWFAANSSIAAVVFGTIIFALGVSLRQAVLATLAGVALSFVPLGLGTLAGKRSGQPTMVISRATFGVVGNILPALISLFSRIFWAAALLWVLGAGTADVLVGARLTDGFTRSELALAAMAIGFVLAVVIAYFGFALIARVQMVVSIVSAISIIGFIVLTLRYVNLTTALSTPDGPWILVITGAVLVFSFVGLAWANTGADVARYQRNDSSGAASMLWATFGAALPSFVLIAYGALLAASNATLAANIAADPLDSLARLLPIWYPAPLLAATVLSLLSGVVLSIYSGGFALQSAGVQLRRSLSTLIVGILTLLIAVIMMNALTDFTQLFRDLATTIAVPVAAWAGLFGTEIMMRRRRFDSVSLLTRGGIYQDVRWSNLFALVVIIGIGYGFLSATMGGLTWEGYLFAVLGVPLHGQLAGTDLGVLVALVLGLLFPLVAGRGAIRRQEKATRFPE